MPAPPAPTILGREPGAMGGTPVVASVQVPINMGKEIWQWNKMETPFVSMVMKFNRQPMPITYGRHLEDKKLPNWVTYTGSTETAGSEEASAFSAGEITNWDRLNVYDLVFNPRSEEVFLFKTVSDTASVIRGGSIGSHTAPLFAGDTLLRFSSQKDEGGVARDAMSTLKEAKYWYAGIWRHATELTLDTQATEMYGGPGAKGRDERKYQKKRTAWEQKKEISQHAILGTIGGDFATAITPTAGFGHMFSPGLMGLIQTNIWNCNGSLKWDDLKAWMRTILHYIPKEHNPMLITSAKVIDIITSYGNDMIQITPKQSYWGWEFDTVRIGGRTVALVEESILNEDAKLEGYGFLGTPAHAAWHPVVGNSVNLDTKLHENIKTHNNPELVKDEFVTHGGFEFFIEPSWGRFYGA